MELGELIGVVCGERGKGGARALLASTMFILFSPSDWKISSASVSFWDFLAVYKMSPSIIGANVPISKEWVPEDRQDQGLSQASKQLDGLTGNEGVQAVSLTEHCHVLS